MISKNENNDSSQEKSYNKSSLIQIDNAEITFQRLQSFKNAYTRKRTVGSQRYSHSVKLFESHNKKIIEHEHEQGHENKNSSSCSSSLSPGETIIKLISTINININENNKYRYELESDLYRYINIFIRLLNERVSDLWRDDDSILQQLILMGKQKFKFNTYIINLFIALCLHKECNDFIHILNERNKVKMKTKSIFHNHNNNVLIQRAISCCSQYLNRINLFISKKSSEFYEKLINGLIDTNKYLYMYSKHSNRTNRLENTSSNSNGVVTKQCISFLLHPMLEIIIIILGTQPAAPPFSSCMNMMSLLCSSLVSSMLRVCLERSVRFDAIGVYRFYNEFIDLQDWIHTEAKPALLPHALALPIQQQGQLIRDTDMWLKAEQVLKAMLRYDNSPPQQQQQQQIVKARGCLSFGLFKAKKSYSMHTVVPADFPQRREQDSGIDRTSEEDSSLSHLLLSAAERSRWLALSTACASNSNNSMGSWICGKSFSNRSSSPSHESLRKDKIVAEIGFDYKKL